MSVIASIHAGFLKFPFVFFFFCPLQKSSKQYKRAFDQVLSGSFGDALPTLLSHLRLLDASIARPLREYNDAQEAIKQCYSAMANCARTKATGGKKDLVV